MSENQAEVTTPPVTVGGDEWASRGKTRLASRAGYEFHPSDTDLPRITPAGVNMTASEADTVLAEAETTPYEGLVFQVTTEKDGE